MNEDENQNNKDSVLNIYVHDEIGISDEVTVELSDITIVEYIKKEPWEGKIELSLPLQKFHPHLPSLKILSLEVRAGQKITYKKYTVKSQQPKDEQKK